MVRVNKEKLHKAVDTILKKYDTEKIRVFAVYDKKRGLQIRCYGIRTFDEERIKAWENRLEITSCFDSVSRMIIVSDIYEKVISWLD